jgi:hypothetical protein
MWGLGKVAVVAAAVAIMVGVPAGSAVAGPAPAHPRAAAGAVPDVHPKIQFAGAKQGSTRARALPPLNLAWAGYIDDNPTAPPVFHSVSAFFKVPPLNCNVPPNLTGAMQGVGIDGLNGHDMEEADVKGTCINGVASDVAGWQMIPGPFTPQFAVNAGDVVRASVSYDLNLTYTLAVNDVTTGQAFAVNQRCTATCDNVSAEVVTQAFPPHPPVGNGALADFGNVVFYNIQVSDYTCAGVHPLVWPACWGTMGQRMGLRPGFHHAVPSLPVGDKFRNVWQAVP